MEGLVSQLPKDIIHHILSFLKTKEGARASLFCKAWHRAWLTCPTLNFGEGWYYFDRPDTREKFLRCIKSTLQRYQEQKIGIFQLTMAIIISDPYSASTVDQWIGIAVQNGVQRLELDLSARSDPHRSYALPRKLFEAKTLRELKVYGSNKLLWSDHKVMFNNFQVLYLCRVHISDVTFQDIIRRCPLIEDLHVVLCVGLVRIKVNNLCNLKKFTVWVEGNQSVEIEAPHLQYLCCDLRTPGCSLQLCTTQELKHLSINGYLPSAATILDNVKHKLPQLEDLSLTTCHGLEKKIDVSSHSLKRVVLKNIEGLKEVKINSPSLLSFEFQVATKTSFPNVSLTNVSNQLKSNISAYFYELNAYDQFRKMKKFLAKLLPSTIFLDLRSDYSWEIDAVMKIPVYPVVEVEVLHMHLPLQLTSALGNFLDALFVTCHPKAIKVRRFGDDATTNFLHQNLIARRNQGLLKRVTPEIYDETEYEWVLSYVCFRLEWEAYSNAREA